MDQETRDQFQRLFDFLDGRFSAINDRFERLEEKVDGHHDEELANFDALFKRLERLETEYHAITSSLSRLERDFRDDRKSREELRSELESLRGRVHEMEERIAELEAALRDRDHHDA